MKYIKKLILENFQSHKYSEIELDPYLNVIVGPSDQGKSAIIRALKWVLFNEPAGDFFIREGESECSVTVIFNDNVKVKRFRSKSKNTYYLYNASGDEMIFEGFGTSVPQEIKDITSIRKVELDSNQSNSINISEQLEGPFLISEKNSTKANAIGRIVGVHIVDDALKDTLKDIRNLNIRKKNHEDTLEKLEKDLSEYDYLDKLIEDFNRLKEIKQIIYNNEVRLKKLEKSLTLLKKIEEDSTLLKKDLEDLNNIYQIIKIEKSLKEKIEKFNYINNRYTILKNVKTQIGNNKKLLFYLQDLNEADRIVKDITDLYNKLNRLNKLNIRYKYTINKINSHKKILVNLNEIYDIDKKTKLIENNLLKLSKLSNLKNKLEQIKKSLSIGTIYVGELSKTDSILAIKESLEMKTNLLERLMDCKKNYYYIKNNKLETKTTLEGINIQMNKLLKQYRLMLTKIEVCPICFGNIDKLKIDEIINSYK